MRGMAGAIGQQFSSFSWVPRQAGIPVGTVIPTQPMPVDGTYDANNITWIQASTGRNWTIRGLSNPSPPVPPAFAANPAWQGSSRTFPAPAFPLSGGAPPPPSITSVATDVSATYGTWSFRINQLAATIDPSTYLVAVLVPGGRGTSQTAVARANVATADPGHGP